ncbi:MAG: hypothetical protein HYW26_02280 [Candidatus Aenigmarchaeota archaeon]|nr:hypothetical protein [Candidatus Aenigmarchaeota archaeon]
MATVERRVFRGSKLLLVILLLFFLIPGILYWYWKTEKVTEKRKNVKEE